MKRILVTKPKTQKKLPGSQNSIDEASLYHKMIEEVEDYAILLIDKDGIVLNWNKGAEKIKGYKAAEIIGKNFRLFYTEEDRKTKLPDKLLKIARTEGHAMQEGWRLRKDGTRFWGSISINSIIEKGNKIIGYTKVTRDLTEKKQNESIIRQAVLDVQEKERNEIAGLLHDSVGQMLVTGKIYIEQAKKSNQPDLCDKGVQNIIEALHEIRNLSHQLNPAAELQGGLDSSVNMLVNDLNVSKKTKFRHLKTGRPYRLKPEIEKNIYRIIQELCSNILKHAKAKNAAIKLYWKKQYLAFTISDDGIGFNPGNVKKGLGFHNTNYRVDMYYGTLTINSFPGKGTTVTVKIPDIMQKPG